MKTPRKGYKQTDIGIISEAWNVVCISQIGNTYSGLSGKKAADFGIGAAKYIPFLNILTTPQRDITFLELVDVRDEERQNRVEIGDLFFNTSSETPEEVGMCSVILENISNLFLNSFCFGFRLYRKEEVDGLFLSYFFRSKHGRELMAELAQGATRYNLAKSNFMKVKIPLPKYEEQQAIAEVLSDIDSLIETIDKKIAKKRAIKEGAMQQLLIGKKRLSGFSKPWIEVELKEDLYFQPGHPFQSSYFNTDRNGLRLIRNRDLKSDDQVIFYNGIKLDDFIVENGDLLVSMDGDFSPAIWMKGTALLNQRVGRIRSKGSWSLQYFFYALIKPLQIIQNGVGATTVKHLSHNQVENMTLCIPSSRQEQQAIAQILTDMDDEIEQLEKQRAKYSYLKRGAMQKLLTGEIRLVKAAAQPQKSAEIRTIPVSAHIVGGHIVNKLHDSKGWGRTKLQKSIHLVSYCCQIDVGARFIRNTAGPDDQELMNYIDSKFKLYRQVDIETTTDRDNRKHYNYIPTSMIDEVEQAFENYPAETQKAANDLLAKIWKMDLARAEIVSTLYAVWNNRIIKKQPINNTLLLENFYDWSEHKADFSQDLVLRALSYMNKEGIIPIGWGKYIDKK